MCTANSTVAKPKLHNHLGGVGVSITVDLTTGAICGFRQLITSGKGGRDRDEAKPGKIPNVFSSHTDQAPCLINPFPLSDKITSVSCNDVWEKRFFKLFVTPDSFNQINRLCAIA